MKKAATSVVGVLFVGFMFSSIFNNINSGLQGIHKNMGQVQAQASVLAYD